MEHHAFDGGDYQKWALDYLNNGYYRIYSVESGLALSVPSGSENSSDVDLIQEAYGGYNRQQWEITPTSDGRYKIKARSATDDLVICVNAGTANGTNIQQDDYVDNNSYLDEWYLHNINGTQAMLMGIHESDILHDHETALGEIMHKISKCGYKDFNCILTDNISRAEVQNHMESARIYVSRSHGGTGSNSSYILLSDDNTSSIHSTHIFDFANNTPVIDLSNCDLMLFIACYTGVNEDVSLPHAAVAAGADCAVGFKDELLCPVANDWTKYFFDYYEQGYSVEYSAEHAAEDCLYIHNIDDYRIVYE